MVFNYKTATIKKKKNKNNDTTEDIQILHYANTLKI